MPTGKINIIGRIGNTYNEDGSLKEKGVELPDVIMQVEANKVCDVLDCLIESEGGSVDVGKAIAKYVKDLPGIVNTIAGKYCASMGTEIHLSRPLDQRKKIQGGRYIIHNPLLVGVSGNAAELVEAADHIKGYEKDMLAMYHNATGLDKSALEGLMAQETDLTDDQCKAFNFVSEIIATPELKAVASINKTTKKTELIDMGKEIKTAVEAAFAGVLETLRGGKKKIVTVVAAKKVDGATAEMLTTDGDVALYTDSPLAGFEADNTKVVKVFSDEAMTIVVADGEYTLKDGSIIKVAAGVVTEYTPVAPMDGSTEGSVEELAARVAELEAENKAIEARMRAEFDTELTAVVTEIKKSMGSNYTPKGEVKKFGKTTVAAKKIEGSVKSMKELAAERSAAYKANKA